MPHFRLFVLAAVSSVVPVLAQPASFTFKTGRELLSTPQHYIGTSVTVTVGFCVYDQPNIVCFGDETPFEVQAADVSDPRILTKLKDKCGDDLPGKEHDPTPFCTFSFSFVPTSVKIGIGDYVLHNRVQSNKRMVLYQTNMLKIRAR